MTTDKKRAKTRKTAPSKSDKKTSEEAVSEKTPKSADYFPGLGRRKEAVARVRIFSSSSKDTASEKKLDLIVNKKPYEHYFSRDELRNIASSPLRLTGEKKNFSVTVQVSGGGIRGQAEAIRLAISRALATHNIELRKPLRDLGYLTRDDRAVERKKAGLKKARRAPQWKKR